MEIGSDTEGTSVNIEPFDKLSDKGKETNEKEGKENGIESQQNNKEIDDVRLDDNKLNESFANESDKSVQLKIIEDSDIIGKENLQVQHDEKKDNLIEDVVNCGDEHELNGHGKDDIGESCDKDNLTYGSGSNGQDIKGDRGTDISNIKSVESAEGLKVVEADITAADNEKIQSPEHDFCEKSCAKDQEENKEKEMGTVAKAKVEAKDHAEIVDTDTRKAGSSDINTDCQQSKHDSLTEIIDVGETSADIDESDIIAVSAELTCDTENSNEVNQNKEQSATSESNEEGESCDVISCDEKVKKIENETDSANLTGEETKTNMSAGNCTTSLDGVQEDCDHGLFDDDDVFDDKDLVEEPDPKKQAEVDSFISSVCEEMVQGMIKAEVEFSSPDKTAEHRQDTVQEGEVLESASGDPCDKMSEETAALEHEALQQGAAWQKTSTESTAQDKALDEAVGDLHDKISEDSAENDKDKSDSGDMTMEQCGSNLKSSGATEKDLQSKQLTEENMLLRGELEDTRTQLHTAQSQARAQQASHNEAVMALKVRLYQTETETAQQQGRAERQLSEVMSHLVLLEGRLKREQCRVRREVHAKDQLIQGQNMEILKLREQNEQLLNAIKEIYAKGGMNGYMRDKKKGGAGSEGSESGKNSRDKKVHNGKLMTVKDKFSWKNRSSLELNNFDLEKYLIKNERLYSSHEDLHNPGTPGSGGRHHAHFPDTHASSPSATGKTHKHKHPTTPALLPNGDHNKKSPRNSQNFFYDEYSPKHELSSSVSESSQLSEQSSTSGFHSLSDHDLSNNDVSTVSNTNGNTGYSNNDDDDDHYFSFSSTRINTVIDEEGPAGPGGQMMYMGSMPLLANIPDEQLQRLRSHKDRPHSLSSVDLISIQRQADALAHTHTQPEDTQSEITPPSSPSQLSGQNKSELTPFQTFKTMFKRKGSKNKNHKKRSVSLSQTTNQEYKEAMKKHFQKYDMS